MCSLNTNIPLIFISVQYFLSYYHFKVSFIYSLALLEACSLLDIGHQILAKVLDRYKKLMAYLCSVDQCPTVYTIETCFFCPEINKYDMKMWNGSFHWVLPLTNSVKIQTRFRKWVLYLEEKYLVEHLLYFFLCNYPFLNICDFAKKVKISPP